MSEMCWTDKPPEGTPQSSFLINRADMARANKAIDGYVEQGYGIDGMPLQRGQSPLTKRRPRGHAENSGGGSGDAGH